MLAIASPVITEIMRSRLRRNTSSASDETERMVAL
jgi:hypothetical protein